MSSWRYRGSFSDRELEVYLTAVRRRVSIDATSRFDRSILGEIARFTVHSKRMRLHVSTLHVNGEQDPLTQGLSHAYLAYADDMALELVPNCGHFIAEERPSWLIERLERFLTQATR